MEQGSYVSVLLRCEQQGGENPVGVVGTTRNRDEKRTKVLMAPS